MSDKELMFRLWGINRWLRYTGLRLAVEPATIPDGDTKIGVMFVGFPGSKGWKRWEG